MGLTESSAQMSSPVGGSDCQHRKQLSKSLHCLVIYSYIQVQQLGWKQLIIPFYRSTCTHCSDYIENSSWPLYLQGFLNFKTKFKAQSNRSIIIFSNKNQDHEWFTLWLKSISEWYAANENGRAAVCFYWLLSLKTTNIAWHFIIPLTVQKQLLVLLIIPSEYTNGNRPYPDIDYVEKPI